MFGYFSLLLLVYTVEVFSKEMKKTKISKNGYNHRANIKMLLNTILSHFYITLRPYKSTFFAEILCSGFLLKHFYRGQGLNNLEHTIYEYAYSIRSVAIVTIHFTIFFFKTLYTFLLKFEPLLRPWYSSGFMV